MVCLSLKHFSSFGLPTRFSYLKIILLCRTLFIPKQYFFLVERGLFFASKDGKPLRARRLQIFVFRNGHYFPF